MDRAYYPQNSPEISPTRRSHSPPEVRVWDSPNVLTLLLNIILHTTSSILLWLSWQFEWAHATAHSILCFFTRRKSRGSPSAESSAVVVMGAGEGLGRALALKLAMDGYTVFACLAHDVPTPQGRSSRSSTGISPLLYNWHRKKARSEDPISGTIVPLVFDASLSDDCERAKDTIRAYCTQHNVTLRTLLVPPMDPAGSASSSGSGYPSSGFTSGNISPVSAPTLSPISSSALWKPNKRGHVAPSTPLLQTSQMTMHESMSKTIFQPLGMVQALASMLHEARSQVIFVSGGDEASFRPSQGVRALCDAARERTARTLQAELGPLGIQVSHITIGPLHDKAAEVASLGHNPTNGNGAGADRTRRFLALVSLLWAIDERTCFRLIKSVIETRYPRVSYRFGVDVLLTEFAITYLPSNVVDFARRILVVPSGSGLMVVS